MVDLLVLPLEGFNARTFVIQNRWDHPTATASSLCYCHREAALAIIIITLSLSTCHYLPWT
jgi:hypothetical protein